MPAEPDYRSEKMESSEGLGRARDRWAAYIDSLDPVIVGAVYDDGLPFFDSDWAKETSELVGFWIAWHLAGGFAALERAGWNRATIFRKARRFRAVFGQHPDEYEFPWITLDLRHEWNKGLRRHALKRTGQWDPSKETR